MKMMPVIQSSDLQRSLHFHTQVLDFERKWPGHEAREFANGVIDLVRDGAELQVSHQRETASLAPSIVCSSTISTSDR